ncbi:MAG: phenylalanine 4-monooxygenase, partial [Acidobacteria bacterium]|nr:phenylalanine 4-monooxygenase [Acidobacteriota bacterium]
AKDIAILDLDHPGAKDPEYRKRRNYIAEMAKYYREHGGVPVIEYTDQEHEVWRIVNSRLSVLHEKHASRIYLESKDRLKIPTDHIPQLNDLSGRLEKFHGFRLEAIEGLVDSRSFMGKLAQRVMWCTQYIRHASRPEYTPEPDVVHEVVGHVPTFVDRDFVELSELIGRAALAVSDEQLAEVERVYWYTIEFGLIEERGAVKAYGAGLLSSFGELEAAFSGRVPWKPFVLEEVLNTPYDYSHMQPHFFIVPSFAFLRQEIERLCASYSVPILHSS